MQSNRGRDTRPELAVRRLLYASGLRYRVNFQTPAVPRRTIDIAFTAVKVACFLDGCFWHGCPDHFQMPKTNTAFWDAKIRRNRDRDSETDALLAAAGWVTLRFWEHQDPESVASSIRDTVASRTRTG